jgi:hypothetical protein
MTSNNKWLINWVILSIAAPLVSFIGGYGYLYVLALLYPIAQTYALAKIQHIKMPWIWLVYWVYWMVIVVYSSTIQFTIIGIIASSILGQILLYLMFDTLGKFQWLLYNSTGICIVLLVLYLMRELHISNDFIEITLIIVLSFIIAFLSGLGIKKGYLK